MPRILVRPEALRTLSAQLQQAAQDLGGLGSRVNSSWSSLDWEVRQKTGLEGQTNDVRSRTSTLAAQADNLGRYLASKAQAFEEADQRGVADLNAVIAKYPLIPIQPPAEPPTGRGIIDFLGDWLKPVEWVADHKVASRRFHDVMQQMGRWLNQFLGTRGYIKQFDALAGILEGSSKAIGGLGNLVDLRDFQRFFAGEITNQEIARTAIKALIPIPLAGDRVADWLIHNMPDPAGKWQGFVHGVE